MNRNLIYKLIIFVNFVVALMYLIRKSPLQDTIQYLTTYYSNNYPLSTDNLFVRTYPKVMLKNTWLAYKDKIQRDGRVIDRSRNYMTTSEGQSYALLRAVWMDDKETFDRVLKWTNHNLRKRPQDKLFAWEWGQRSDGSWDVMYEDGGINTASDADQDIALALILAYKRWGNATYLDQATEVLHDIWRVEVLKIGDDYYLLAGNWAKNEKYPTINPSYFSFAAYPIFAKVDTEHPWLKLKDTSYKVLNSASADPLDVPSSVFLPPDWVMLNPVTNNIMSPEHSDKTTHFSDDAYRAVWRVALDWYWFHDTRAKDFLEKIKFLADTYKAEGKLVGSYTHAGEPVVAWESPSMYGSVVSGLKVTFPDVAHSIYYDKLVPLYDPDLENFKEDLGYYSQNWVWFGMALYGNSLPNLSWGN